MSETVFNHGALKASTEAPYTSTGLASKDHMAANGIPLQNGEKHFVTGRCITCDSRVRWPRHLDVFRCTVCLMVNDLKLGAESSIGGREAESPITPTPSSSPDLPTKGTADSMIITLF